MTTTVFSIDPRDQDRASDGVSRYGSYLYSRSALFLDDGEPTRDPQQFALTALRVALPPVMSPGYVFYGGDVLGAQFRWDDDARAAVAVTLVSALPDTLARTIGRQWTGWHREWGSDPHWYEPYDNDGPVALPTLLVRVPLPVDHLPAPAYDERRVPDLDVAQAAVRTVVTELNTRLAPVVEALAEAGVR